MATRFRLSSIPWTPIVVSALVLLSSAFAVQPLRDAATLEGVPEATLDKPLGYVVLAPLSNVLDTVTLMSVKQHIAVAVSLLVILIGYRAARHFLVGSTWKRHAVVLAWSIGGFVLTYVAVAALPRPMAKLGVQNAHLARVDFHSHTSGSHDGRPGFTAERNRAWHRAAGFDIAFISDHAGVAAAEQGMANNPTTVSPDNLFILQSMEVTWTGEHVGILGAERSYKGLTTQNLRDIDPQALALASLIGGREPVLVWHHPRALNRIPIADTSGNAGVSAIEIVNGSPDGMDHVRPKRLEIVRLAERGDIALVSGTDNHGWGYAAPAWTVLFITNWRAMNAEQLMLSVERTIRDGGFKGTRVVERVVADPGDDPRGMLGAIVFVPWKMLTTLSNDERSVWLLWTWLVWGAAAWNRRRSARMAA